MAVDQDARGSSEAAEGQGPRQAFAVGERVRLALPLRYLKTADPMPMLRPPDLVDAEEVGVIREVRARDLLAVRFRRGTFLIAARELIAAD